MIVSVIYPKTADSHFNMDYYLHTHTPLVKARWTEFGLKSVKVMHGAGAPGGGAAGFEVITLLEFGAADDFLKAAGAHGPEVMGDIPNFTNVQPAVQFNESIA